MLLIQFSLYTCPKCNQDFYNELLSQGGNSLGRQELLEAIKNQIIPGEPSTFAPPAGYNSLTDVQQSDSKVTSYAGAVNNNNSPSNSDLVYLPYVFIFIRSLVFGQLML